MTSLAFMLGVTPLMLGSGAGSGARHALGTSVFGGMLSATLLAVFFVPLFYVLVRRMARRIQSDGALTRVAARERARGVPRSVRPQRWQVARAIEQSAVADQHIELLGRLGLCLGRQRAKCQQFGAEREQTRDAGR